MIAFFIVFAILFGLLFLLFLPFIAIVDILRSKFNGNDNILMLLIVIFIPFGFILYFLIAPSRKVRT